MVGLGQAAAVGEVGVGEPVLGVEVVAVVVVVVVVAVVVVVEVVEAVDVGVGVAVVAVAVEVEDPLVLMCALIAVLQKSWCSRSICNLVNHLAL